MKAIAEHIFEGGNDKFDEKQYWTYGCHCFFLGDRPLSDMGKGTPVDQLRVRKKIFFSSRFLTLKLLNLYLAKIFEHEVS